jgi:hypothetical protein
MSPFRHGSRFSTVVAFIRIRVFPTFLLTWFITGDRFRVPARDGQTLYEVAVANNVVVGDLFTCHVVLTPDSFNAHQRPMSEEESHLESVHGRAPTSRMASFLKLTSSVPETAVALVDVRDYDTP